MSNFKKAGEARNIKSGSQSHRNRANVVDGKEIPNVESIIDKIFGDFNIKETLAESKRQYAMEKSRA